MFIFEHMHARCGGNISQRRLFFLPPAALFQLGSISCETAKLRVSKLAPFCDPDTLNENVFLQTTFF